MSYPQKTIAECAEIISGLVEQKDSGAASCLYEAVLPSQITPAGFIPEYGQIQRIPTYYMPFLNIGVFFAVEIIIHIVILVIQRIKRSKTV